MMCSNIWEVSLLVILLSLILLNCTHASSPQYIIPGTEQINTLNKSRSKDKFSFNFENNKSRGEELRVKEVSLNGQVFSISLQEAYRSDEPVPFFKVNFPKDEVDFQLYGLMATQGTSGSQYHYFFRKPDGVFVYSGLHPEIIFDNETKKFISYEKDGPHLFETIWDVKDFHFISRTLSQVN